MLPHPRAPPHASPLFNLMLAPHASPLRTTFPLLATSNIPQFPEIVVSVARKTDAALWPALFAAVGSPLRLCQGLMRADQLQASFGEG